MFPDGADASLTPSTPLERKRVVKQGKPCLIGNWPFPDRTRKERAIVCG